MESSSSFSKVSNLVMGKDGFQIFKTEQDFDQNDPCFKIDKATGSASFRNGRLKVGEEDIATNLVTIKQTLTKLETMMGELKAFKETFLPIFDKIKIKGLSSDIFIKDVFGYSFAGEFALIFIYLRHRPSPVGTIEINYKHDPVPDKLGRVMRVLHATASSIEDGNGYDPKQDLTARIAIDSTSESSSIKVTTGSRGMEIMHTRITLFCMPSYSRSGMRVSM